jgi:hypothetical protein
VSVIHKLINCIWNKVELPNQWKESVIVSVHKKGDIFDSNNHCGTQKHEYHVYMSSCNWGNQSTVLHRQVIFYQFLLPENVESLGELLISCERAQLCGGKTREDADVVGGVLQDARRARQAETRGKWQRASAPRGPFGLPVIQASSR